MGKTRDLFKKIRDTKGTFHAKMGLIKDRNGMDLIWSYIYIFIHFEFIFVYGVRKCPCFILLQVDDHFSQHHLLKRLSFLHCIFLPPLSKIRCPSDQITRSVVSDSLRPMNCSTPGLPVHHQLLEFTQTHVHRVSDAIQPSHPLSSPSPPAPNPSQHQSLFQ